jgi:hypothetical protein
MRISYFFALVVTILGAFTYWYQTTAADCPVPISYRIGEIDPAFGLKQEQVLAYVSQAEDLWESQVQRELFTYDENAKLSIQFIYDDRQADANSEVAQRGDLDEQKEKSESVRIAIEELQTKYDKLSVSHNDQVAAYEAKLNDYNAEVNKYNDRGGAPEEVFERLEKERNELSAKAEELNRISEELKTIAGKINELADQGNALVENYNDEVAKYNQEFGFAREFTQGDYQGERIHVYKFSSDEELVTVLAHEFGHALGLGHVEDTSSLMYYLLENTDEAPTLSSLDLASYEAVCGYAESFTQKVRRMIREVLATIN